MAKNPSDLDDSQQEMIDTQRDRSQEFGVQCVWKREGASSAFHGMSNGDSYTEKSSLPTSTYDEAFPQLTARFVSHTPSTKQTTFPRLTSLVSSGDRPSMGTVTPSRTIPEPSISLVESDPDGEETLVAASKCFRVSPARPQKQRPAESQALFLGTSQLLMQMLEIFHKVHRQLDAEDHNSKKLESLMQETVRSYRIRINHSEDGDCSRILLVCGHLRAIAPKAQGQTLGARNAVCLLTDTSVARGNETVLLDRSLADMNELGKAFCRAVVSSSVAAGQDMNQSFSHAHDWKRSKQAAPFEGGKMQPLSLITELREENMWISEVCYVWRRSDRFCL
ncbi:hypothetical protein NliqN6_3501 [Naganishia liquefaciens]|uniref:Uncharacterized protein n=1 Tax=Naganishia liquefaciens TaxID=104408 RepID=A0A8H3YF14_9TREE|nr:hypothetical protein NliqN6_3501 [Naganishia liquefaciens]